MSSPIWTPAGLSSEARPLAGRAWRPVEAQHQVSTAKLTDTLADQHRLERIIEATKPAIPEECRHLHFLLATPFRYGAPYPRGSRFRRAGLTPGVFYASELSRTAMIEIAFWRLLFFAESPDTPWPENAGEFTAFAVEFATVRAIDLAAPPFDRHRDVWRHPTDYSMCQGLADDARAQGIQILRYESARAGDRAIDFALLTCRVFQKMEEVGRQTWRMHLSSSGVRLFCEMPAEGIDLPRTAFARDPRTADMHWDR
jgi:RES domain